MTEKNLQCSCHADTLLSVAQACVMALNLMPQPSIHPHNSISPQICQEINDQRKIFMLSSPAHPGNSRSAPLMGIMPAKKGRTSSHEKPCLFEVPSLFVAKQIEHEHAHAYGPCLPQIHLVFGETTPLFAERTRCGIHHSTMNQWRSRHDICRPLIFLSIPPRSCHTRPPEAHRAGCRSIDRW